MAKSVFITGASRGLGMLSAVELARRGHRVFAGVRRPTECPALDAAAATAGVSIDKIELDVTAPESISRAVSDVIERAGHIDVLVNNAGINRFGFFESLTTTELDALVRTNFTGAMLMTHAVLPSMRERRAGTILNMSSMYGFAGCAGGAVYAASKWALEGLTESLRHELTPLGVYVTLLQPGYYRTEMLDANFSTGERFSDSSSPYHATGLKLHELFRNRVASRAADPAVVARLVADVAEESAPRLRYLVGKDAHALRFLRSILPANVFDGLSVALVRGVMKESGLVGRSGDRRPA